MSFTLNLDGEQVRIEIRKRHPKLVLWIDGQEHVVGPDAGSVSGTQLLDIDGRAVRFTRAGTDDRCMIRLAGRTFELTLPDASSSSSASLTPISRRPLSIAILAGTAPASRNTCSAALAVS